MNIIDCDIHPRMPKGVQSLKPYLPEKWQARLGMKRGGSGKLNRVDKWNLCLTAA
jgi:hypothetical protein